MKIRFNFFNFISALLFIGYFFFFSTPSPPDYPLQRITLEQFFENPSMYSKKFVSIKDAISLGGEFFGVDGFYTIEGRDGHRISVTTHRIPPKEGYIIRDLKVWIKPVFSTKSGKQVFIFKECE